MRILAPVISKTTENSIIMYTIAIRAPHGYIIYGHFQERCPLPGSLVERKRRMLNGANLPVPRFYSPTRSLASVVLSNSASSSPKFLGRQCNFFCHFFSLKKVFSWNILSACPCYGKRVRFPRLIPTLVTEVK